MATRFSSFRHQAVLNTPTGYRRWSRFTFSRGGVSQVLEPTSARLTQDVRRNARWDGQLTFTGDELLPRRPGDLLTPFGTRVDVEIGLEMLDGSVSSVPYGVYEVGSSRSRLEADSRVVDVGLIDLSNRVDRYRFENPYTVASGTDLATLVNSVVADRLGVNPNVSATGSTLGAARTFGLEASTGPWDEILDVLASFGKVAWYNRTGQIQIASIDPDPATAYPIDQLTSLDSDFDTQPPNVVVARGEAQDDVAPVQGIAMDTDPSSPTYAGTGPGTSPYGRVTRYYSSPLIETVPQAQSAAESILAQYLGQGATYALVRPFDPTIDGNDVVNWAGDALAVDEITLNLSGQTTMQARRL